MPVTFIWPGLLWGLLLVPAVLALYVRLLRRALPASLPHPVTPLVAIAASRGSRFTRYLPAALLLLALTSAVVAVARPVVPLPVPADRSAIILAIDSSGSMRSQDILPTRLDAAKAAAKDFVAALPNRVRLGLVMFGGYALLLVPPGTDRPRILEAVVALPERSRPGLDGTLPAPSGPRPPGIVILLSDGRSNTGIDPLEAAEIARRQEGAGYPIGVGQPFTPDNVYTIGGSLDEYTLKEIARLTGGTYHHASSAEALRSVYQKLARTVGWERRPQEAGALAAALAAVVLLAALAFSRLVTHPLGV